MVETSGDERRADGVPPPRHLRRPPGSWKMGYRNLILRDRSRVSGRGVRTGWRAGRGRIPRGRARGTAAVRESAIEAGGRAPTNAAGRQVRTQGEGADATADTLRCSTPEALRANPALVSPDEGGAVIKCPSPLDVRKDTYTHSCY